MKIGLDISALQQEKWKDYAIRFVFGGAITMLTGLIAKRYGPGVAGLFLAFPAIFPAGATLIEKHEEREKQRVGLHGTLRGRALASVDAAGAAMGSVGLLAFALLVWLFLPGHHAWIVLTGAGAVWMTVAVTIWWIRKLI